MSICTRTVKFGEITLITKRKLRGLGVGWVKIGEPVQPASCVCIGLLKRELIRLGFYRISNYTVIWQTNWTFVAYGSCVRSPKMRCIRSSYNTHVVCEQKRGHYIRGGIYRKQREGDQGRSCIQTGAGPGLVQTQNQGHRLAPRPGPRRRRGVRGEEVKGVSWPVVRTEHSCSWLQTSPHPSQYSC